MSKRFRMSTALDIDDLLMECIPYAIRLANEKYKFDPPLTIHEVDRWGKLGTRADVIFEFFDDPEFFRTQPVIAGAREFVQKLSEMTEVFVSTSITPRFMGIRAQRILEEFPEIPPENIYMGARKDKINVDILFDDGMHNVFRSQAAYPILMRKPWNRKATGMLAVNTYDEFLKLVEVITKSYSASPERLLPGRAGMVVLVGPSGSEKNEIARRLLELLPFERLKSYTTNPKAPEAIYHIVSVDEYQKMCDRGELFESTMYASHGYGSRFSDVSEILARGNHVLTVMDICGAMALKTNFDNVITVYIKRNREALLRTILEEDIPTEEKVGRLISIEGERNNEEICDYSIAFDSVDEAVEKLLTILK